MPMNESTKIITAPLKWLWLGGVLLIKGWTINSTTGAKFASASCYSNYLTSANRGLLLDGSSLALSEQESFKGVCTCVRACYAQDATPQEHRRSIIPALRLGRCLHLRPCIQESSIRPL